MMEAKVQNAEYFIGRILEKYPEEAIALSAIISTLEAKLYIASNALKTIDSDCRKCWNKGFDIDIESTRDFISIALKEIGETE